MLLVGGSPFAGWRAWRLQHDQPPLPPACIPTLQAQLGISQEQRQRILVHWQAYQERVAVARQLGREAMQQLQQQEAARQRNGIPGAAGTLFAAAKVRPGCAPPHRRGARICMHGSLSGQVPAHNSTHANVPASPACPTVQHFLSSFQATSELAALPSEEAAAWLELQHAIWQVRRTAAVAPSHGWLCTHQVWSISGVCIPADAPRPPCNPRTRLPQILTPLQNSRLLLGCTPYVPDCTQMCRLLEWQQQQQQQGRLERQRQGRLERRLSQGDPGHLLAAAAGAATDDT